MNKDMLNNFKIIGLLLVVFIILYALHVTIGDRIGYQNGEPFCNIDGPTIIFMHDNETKTLTVTNIYPEDKDFYWPEISIKNGSATLPYGTIEIGDMITNCEGSLELVWGTSCIPIVQVDFT